MTTQGCCDIEEFQARHASQWTVRAVSPRTTRSRHKACMAHAPCNAHLLSSFWSLAMARTGVNLERAGAADLAIRGAADRTMLRVAIMALNFK